MKSFKLPIKIYFLIYFINANIITSMIFFNSIPKYISIPIAGFVSVLMYMHIFIHIDSLIEANRISKLSNIFNVVTFKDRKHSISIPVKIIKSPKSDKIMLNFILVDKQIYNILRKMNFSARNPFIIVVEDHPDIEEFVDIDFDITVDRDVDIAKLKILL